MKIFDGYHVFVENGPADNEALTAARRLVVEARRVSDARGLHAYRDYQELADGTQIYVLRHGDIGRVHIIVPPKEEAFASFKSILPDFISGIATAGHIETAVNGARYISGFYPTDTSRIRLGIGEGPLDMPRLAVEPDWTRDDLRNPSNNPNAKPYSQVMSIKPSMYSGKMKKVVQFLLGVGYPSLPGKFDKAYSKAIEQIAPTVGLGDAYEREQRLTEVYNQGMKVLYDNRFYRTHGIAKAQNGKLWLVQVGQSGAYAMPLPMWPFSDTEEFREALSQHMDYHDSELEYVLNEFGGIPSGGTFPARANGEFDAWVRAGKVVTMLTSAQTAGPYAMQPFSTACGWAFNEAGTEAHNVMYEYGADDFLYTEHWHFQFEIGGEVAKQSDTESRQRELESLLEQAQAPTPTYKFAVLSKLPWVERSALDSFIALAKMDGPQAAFDALDAHTITRYIASCNLGRSSHEVAWTPGKYLKAPAMMKFYEPLLSGIVNVNLNKLGFQWTWDKGRPPEIIDALMYVYFIGNELNYVRYYYEWNVNYESVSTDDYEECMWQGSWQKDTYTGTNAPSVRFYTTTLDHRRKNAEAEQHIQIRSRYFAVSDPIIGDNPTYPAQGWASRDHVFEREEWITSYNGNHNLTAVIVPAFVREGILYGHADQYASTNKSYYKSYPAMSDPWWYEYARWFGSWRFGPTGIIGGGGWTPLDGKCGYKTDRRVVKEFYSPTVCSDIVDRGPWLTECEVVQGGRYPNYQTSGWTSSVNNPSTFEVWADYPPLGGMTRVYQMTFTPSNEHPYFPWAGNWFYPSPDEYGTIQNAFGLYNCLGDSDLVYGSTGPNNFGPGIYRGEPSTPKRDVYNFVGVVDASA